MIILLLRELKPYGPLRKHGACPEPTSVYALYDWGGWRDYLSKLSKFLLFYIINIMRKKESYMNVINDGIFFFH